MKPWEEAAKRQKRYASEIFETLQPLKERYLLVKVSPILPKAVQPLEKAKIIPYGRLQKIWLCVVNGRLQQPHDMVRKASSRLNNGGFEGSINRPQE